MADRAKHRGGIISDIEKGGIAEDLGWKPGDEILSINGQKLHDIIDYRFHSSEEFLTVAVRRKNEILEYEIEKDFDMSLGVEFEDDLFDGVRLCGAHCLFCFVEQLPKGLRKSLYLKDDDYRLSFLHGNFVTLANVTDEDISRIVTQRLSPLYISVHATEPELRERMLGRDAPNILDQIDALAEGRITLHTQIVLCRGINDGDHLDRTINDLAQRYPTVQSIAIVPAGITAHRRNKTPIPAIDAQYSGRILDKVKHWQRQYIQQKGTRLVWAADEFYLNAGKPIPKASAYESFPQLENGVGLVRKFKDSAYRASKILPRKLEQSLSVSVITGQLAAPLLTEWANSLKCENLSINVIPITNNLFGETVTVTGLIAGNDIIDQLSKQQLGGILVIPNVALRDNKFLDDVTTDEVGIALKTRVLVVEPMPYQLVKSLLTEPRRQS